MVIGEHSECLKTNPGPKKDILVLKEEGRSVPEPVQKKARIFYVDTRPKKMKIKRARFPEERIQGRPRFMEGGKGGTGRERP